MFVFFQKIPYFILGSDTDTLSLQTETCFCNYITKTCVYKQVYIINIEQIDKKQTNMKDKTTNKYSFNSELFMGLIKVLGTSVPVMAEAVDVSTDKFFYWRRNKDIPILDLIRLCDEFLIPIGHFISVDGNTEGLKRRKDYVQTDGKYTSTMFLANAFGDEITTMRGNTIRSVCELFGVGSPTFYNYFRASNAPSKFLTMGEWVEYCNIMKVYPMDFLVGSSVKVPVLPGYSRRLINGNNKMEVLEQRCRELDSQNKKLLSQLRSYRERIKELEKEVDRL